MPPVLPGRGAPLSPKSETRRRGVERKENALKRGVFECQIWHSGVSTHTEKEAVQNPESGTMGRSY